MTYNSVTERECGLSPDGAARCHWYVSFTETRFNWRYSDVIENGTFTCAANTVTGQGLGGRNIVGQYEPATRTLTWDGVAYMPQ